MATSAPLAPVPDAGLGTRDRVLDAVRAIALVVVVMGHSLQWDTSTGSPTAVLEQRDADVGAYLRRGLVRLSTPGLVYVTLWTVLLLPLTPLSALVGFAGRFLAELVWFLAVYATATLAVPWTIRWTRRPWLTIGLWFAAVGAADLVRWNVWAPLGWLNLVLVWGLVHQVGYHLPALQEAQRAWLVAGGVTAVATAVGLGVLGPNSSSMVSFGGDPEPSNLAPPTLVVALVGLGQVLLLAALWPWLARRLAADRTYRAVGAVGAVGARSIGIYLWHIPVVALVAGAAWGVDFRAEPLGAVWWLAHVSGLAAILSVAWAVAGPAAVVDRRARAWAARRRSRTRVVRPRGPRRAEALGGRWRRRARPDVTPGPTCRATWHEPPGGSDRGRCRANPGRTRPRTPRPGRAGARSPTSGGPPPQTIHREAPRAPVLHRPPLLPWRSAWPRAAPPPQPASGGRRARHGAGRAARGPRRPRTRPPSPPAPTRRAGRCRSPRRPT